MAALRIAVTAELTLGAINPWALQATYEDSRLNELSFTEVDRCVRCCVLRALEPPDEISKLVMTVYKSKLQGRVVGARHN